MISTDREILIAINDRIERIESRQQEQGRQIAEIRKDITDIKQEQRMLRHDMENLQHSVYWILAAVVVVFSLTAAIQNHPKKEI